MPAKTVEYFLSMKLQPVVTGLLIFLCSPLSFAQVTQFNWPETVEASDKYDVTVIDENGSYDLYTMISTPNLNEDPNYPDEGHGVTGIFEDRSLSFVQFDYEGLITVEVTKLYGTSAARVEIQPKTLGIEPHYFDGTTVRFQLTHHETLPSYLHVNFISDDNADSDGESGEHILNAMMIFADKPEANKPGKTDEGVVLYEDGVDYSEADIVYFEAGDYDLTTAFTAEGEVGQMPYTRDNQRFYLEGGAVVRGAFHGKELNGLGLYGRGVVTGRDLAWHWFRDDAGEKDAFINFISVDDVEIEGIIVDNPTHHTIPSGENSTIRNLKIIGWASNHDGIRPQSGSTVDQIFIKTSDDYDYARDPHTVSNSILWQAHNGAIGMLGWSNLGTGYAEYENIAFINSETRQADKKNSGIVGSMADDGIKLTGNAYKNLYIEDQHAYLINVLLETVNGGESGYLNDFAFNNIRTERAFQLTNGTVVKQRMVGVPNNWLDGWTFTNLIVAGELVTWDNYDDYFDLTLTGSNGANEDATKYVRNLTFNSEGTIHEITVSSSGSGSFYPAGASGVVQCPDGTSQMINIIPDEGNKIVDVIVDGVSQGRKQKILLENVTSNRTIAITFEAGDDYYDYEPDSYYLDEPILLETDAQKCGQTDLSWNDVDYESHYIIQRKLDGASSYENLDTLVADSQFYSDLDVIVGSGYDYMLKTVAGDTIVNSSNTVSASPASCAAYDIEDLSVTSVVCDQVEISWTDVVFEDKYRIYRSTVDSEGTTIEGFESLGDLDAGASGYTDTEVTPGNSYEYKVHPMQENVEVATSNAPDTTVPICDIEDLTITLSSCNQVMLTWSDRAGEEGYRIRRKLSSESSFTNIEDVAANATSFLDVTPDANTTYTYQVRPLLGGAASGISNQVEITIPDCHVWTGDVSTDWETAANWNKNTVPGLSDDVSIPEGTEVMITGDAAANNLYVNTSELTLGVDASLQIEGDFLGDGTLTVLKNVTGNGGYSILGAPVTSVNASHLDADFFYSYTSSGYEWVPGGTVLDVGKGYFVGYTEENPQVSFTGIPNVGEVSIAVEAGFQLVANPYTTAIAIADFLNENASVLDGTVYFWDDGGENVGDDRGGDFITVNSMGVVGQNNLSDGVDGIQGVTAASNGFITTTQGVFVYADVAGQVLFNSDMQTSETGANDNDNHYRIYENDFLKIRLSMSNERYQDDILIGFPESATTEDDYGFDALKRDGVALSFYSYLGDDKYAIQALPPSSGETTIRLGHTVFEPGNYTLHVDQIEHLAEDLQVSILDNLTKEYHNLQEGDQIKFEVVDALQDQSRFELVIEQVPVLSSDDTLIKDFEIYPNPVSDYLIIQGVQNVEKARIFDLTGQLIQELSLQRNKMDVAFLSQGIYLLELKSVSKSQIIRFIKQ